MTISRRSVTRVSALLGALALSALATGAPAQTAAPVRIAATLPLSGGVASFGEAARWGAEMAIAEANVAGGIKGRPLQLDIQDNRCNPAEAVKVATQMLADPGYVAMFDGLCSSAVLAIMPVVQRASIPYVVATASATSISDQSGKGGNRWTFKFNPSDATMATAMVEWLAKEKLADKVAFLGEDTDFGRSGASGFEAALAAKGQKLLMQDFYQQNTPDFSAVLTRVRAAKPSVLAIYALAGDQKNIISQIMAMGLRVPLSGRLITDVIPAEILASGALDDSTSVQPYSPEIDTPENKAFVTAFTAKYGRAPNSISYSAYDAMRTLVNAIGTAKAIEPAAVRDALEASSTKSLLGGEIKFDANNLAHNLAVIVKIEKGKAKVVGLSGT